MAGSSDQNFDRKRVLRALKYLGFRRAGTGNGTDHDIFINDSGVRCQARVVHHDVGINAISSLGLELEKKGVIGKRQFVQMVRLGLGGRSTQGATPLLKPVDTPLTY